MELRHALETYTVLTIGDGLVTVIPALMISISGGLIVTRTGSEDSLGDRVHKQLLGSAQPLLLAERRSGRAGAAAGIAHHSVPADGRRIGHRSWRMRQKSAAIAADSTVAAAKPKENLEGLLKVEPLSVEVGLGLVNLVERGAESPLLTRVAGIRRQLATQLGYLMPPVKVKDNMALRSREYVIQMRGIEIARFELMQGHELAIPSGNPDPTLQGKATRRSGLWTARDLDSAGSGGSRAQQRLHGGRRRQRYWNASDRIGPTACARIVHAAGRQGVLRPRGAGESQSH